MLEEFRKMHDVLIESVHLNLRKALMARISPEAQKIIQMYMSYFIQFPKFTYLWIGGFEEELVKLRQYALDVLL